MEFDASDFWWLPEWPNESQIIKPKVPDLGLDNEIFPWEYSVTEGHKIWVCISWEMALPFMPTAQNGGLLAYLSLVLLTASIVGLYLTILTHLVFSELRNLPGLNLLAMNACMVSYQQLFLAASCNLILVTPSFCQAVAVSLHFLILSTFFWTNIMAWDLYMTFGQKTVFSQIRPRKYFKYYAAYSFGMPMLIVGTV